MKRLVLVLIALTGCAVDDGIELERWHLDGALIAAPGEVSLPDNLDVADRAGVYTLSARVELPAAWHGAPLTLVISDLAAVAHVTIDGDAAMVTESPVSPVAYRSPGPLSWRVPASATADGAIDLVMTIEHRWTQAAWWGSAPRLVAGDDRPTAAVGVLVFNVYIALAAVISLVQLGLTSACRGSCPACGATGRAASRRRRSTTASVTTRSPVTGRRARPACRCGRPSIRWRSAARRSRRRR